MYSLIATPVFILSALILAIVGLRAYLIVRSEDGKKLRGSAPGKGDHIVQAEYQSGGGGGGSHGQFRVPKDPQAYARAFVPSAAKSKE